MNIDDLLKEQGRKPISEMTDEELQREISMLRESRRQSKYSREKNVKMSRDGKKQKRGKKDPLEKLSRNELKRLKELLGE